MQLSTWPRANPLARLRLLALLGLLALVIGGTIVIKRIAGGAGEAALQVGLTVVSGRLFEGIAGNPPSNQLRPLQSDATYGWSLAKQLSIAAKAEEFYREHHEAPAAIEDMTKYGLIGADAIDPWNRPYRIHILAGDVFVVQSTGRSGKDAVGWDHPDLRKELLTKKTQIVGDNLIVTRSLKGELH
jgi:hypothetical protein